MYSLRAFRAKTKEAFDKAETGVPVAIERAGVIYWLTLGTSGDAKQVIQVGVQTPGPTYVKPALVMKPCVHGADPLFCKHAKLGKPCR